MAYAINFISKLASVLFFALILLNCGGGTTNTVADTGNGSGGEGSNGGGTGVASLTWQPPAANTDGTSLTNLAGYKIYYSTVVGDYSTVIPINSIGITTYVIENLPNGNTYYFVITAINSDGVESAYSTSVSKTIS